MLKNCYLLRTHPNLFHLFPSLYPLLFYWLFMFISSCYAVDLKDGGHWKHRRFLLVMALWVNGLFEQTLLNHAAVCRTVPNTNVNTYSVLSSTSSDTLFIYSYCDQLICNKQQVLCFPTFASPCIFYSAVYVNLHFQNRCLYCPILNTSKSNVTSMLCRF